MFSERGLEIMKKSITLILCIILILLMLIAITGCIDYKTTSADSANQDLLNEIAAIEKELELNNINNNSEFKEPAEAVEDVILPELKAAPDSSKAPAEQVITIKENKKVTLRPKVMDPDNDPVTVTYSTPINSQGEWQTNYGDAGEYTVIVTATDGVTTAAKNLRIIVEKDNVAPTIENIRDLTVNEGETVTFIPKTTDINGDKVTTTISAPLQEGAFKTDFTSAGVYQISVTASDGELETAKSFSLTVNNVNQKPIIKNEEKLFIKEGETLQLTPIVEDPDGDETTVSISEPVGSDGLWKLGYTDNGEYVLTITANDGTDTVSKSVNVVVEDVNAPVEFIEIIVDVN
ncbi:hypothetical protein J4479_00540 [Candidatus Woesearchaeota archaeon]|nr:hypothetical protein [Candidatus Woesearchaeota archaeon]